MCGPFISYKNEVVNLANVVSVCMRPGGLVEFTVVGSESRVITMKWPEPVFKRLFEKVGVIDYEKYKN